MDELDKLKKTSSVLKEILASELTSSTDKRRKTKKKNRIHTRTFTGCNHVRSLLVCRWWSSLPSSAYIHVAADDEEAAASSRSAEGLAPSLLSADALVLRGCLFDDDDEVVPLADHRVFASREYSLFLDDGEGHVLVTSFGGKRDDDDDDDDDDAHVVERMTATTIHTCGNLRDRSPCRYCTIRVGWLCGGGTQQASGFANSRALFAWRRPTNTERGWWRC